MERILLGLFELSISASLMILLMVLLIPLVGKKFSAKWRYWLWILLAIRLLTPFSMELDIPFIQMELPAKLTEVQQIEIDLPEINTASSVEVSQETADPVVEDTAIPPVESDKILWHPSILEMLAYIWLVGVVGSGLWQFIMYFRYQKSTELWNKACPDERAHSIYAQLCEEMNIRNRPVLLMTKREKSPMVIGFSKPKLLLPEMEYSEEDYWVIFRHELCHYKRHDVWYKLLILTARCVHWFNPLVYVMLREAENDLEITCDETVVRGFSNDEKAEYCETILRILCRGKGDYTLLSTGFNSGKKVLQRRFEAVLNEKAGNGIVFGAISFVLMVFLCGFVRVDAAQAEQQANTSAEENTAATYLAIPEEQRPFQKTELVMAEPILPVKQNIEFWEKKATKFFWTNFELKDHLSPEKLGEFFDVVVSDQQLYYIGGVHGGSLIPYNEIRAILYAHLPAQAIQPEGSIRVCNHEFICSELPRDIDPHSLDYVQMFNEDGNKLFPYNEISNTYTLVFKSLVNKYDAKVVESLSTEVQDVEPGVKRMTFELAAYDQEKYYSNPQQKELLETYRFSVRVAEDSWFIEEATLSKVQ